MDLAGFSSSKGGMGFFLVLPKMSLSESLDPSSNGLGTFISSGASTTVVFCTRGFDGPSRLGKELPRIASRLEILSSLRGEAKCSSIRSGEKFPVVRESCSDDCRSIGGGEDG